MHMLAGLLYDTLGRRPVLVIATIVQGICVMLMPYSGTVFPGLLLSRCGLAAGSSAVIGNPLLIDYVHNKSKGAALALLAACIGGASVIVAVVELRLVEYIKLEVFYIIPGCVSFLTAVYFFCFVKEPPETQDRACDNLSQKLGEVCGEIRKREIWVAMVCNFAVKGLDIFAVTLVSLWYTKLAFNNSTVKSSHFMNKYLGAASVFGIFLNFSLGFISDRINYRKIVAPVFLLIGSLLLITYSMACMTCTGTIVLLAITTTVVFSTNTVVGQLIARNIKSSVKGTVLGVYYVCGAVGLLCYGVIGGEMIDSSYNKEIFLGAGVMALVAGGVGGSLWCRRKNI